MAAKNQPCKHCQAPTRRRCRDCKAPVCAGCHVHGQCDDCVDGDTFNQSSRWHGKPPLDRTTADRRYHGTCRDDVA